MVRTTMLGRNMKLKPPFYVVSDTHFGHANIVSYCSRPADHEALMVDRWNSTVGPDDYVLHLGDLMFTGNAKKQAKFFEETGPSLNGRKFMILGNHDREDWIEFYNKAGFNILKPFQIRYEGYYVGFDHYPCARGMIQPGDDYIRVHGHIHSNGYQGQHVKRKESKRYGNINVSVEMINYTPQPVTALLDKAIASMKPKGQRYHNVNKTGAKAKRAA